MLKLMIIMKCIILLNSVNLINTENFLIFFAFFYKLLQTEKVRNKLSTNVSNTVDRLF